MSSTPDSPDWSLLPGAPAEFFGLEGQFDANDLKRSYNRFLKKFKPEKFPDEFQRIRQAYENLERMLRYGYRPTLGPFTVSFGDGQPTPHDTSSDDSSPSDGPADGDTVVVRGPGWPPFVEVTEGGGRHPSGDRRESRPLGPTLLERLETESLDDVIASLRQEPSLKPRDYVHLAILVDARSSGKGTEFFDTLLEGLEKWPSDPALVAVMGEHLNHTPLGDRLLRELSTIAKTLRGPSFYPVTEAAWDRVVTGLPFRKFRQALADCELELPAGDTPHRAVFLAHLLQRAVWKADEAWVEEALAVFDARMVDEVPLVLADVELAEALWRYVRDPVRLADDSPERKRFEKLVRAFTENSGDAAYAEFLRFQVLVERDRDAWIEAFPVRVGEDSSSALDLYRRFESRVGGHLREGVDAERDLGEDARRLHAALKAMEEGIGGFSPRALAWEFFSLWRKNNSRAVWCVILAGVIFFCAFLFAMTVGAGIQLVLSGNSPGAGTLNLLFGLAVVAGGIGGWKLSRPVKDWVEARLVAVENRLATSHYRGKYRPAFLGIFQRLGWGFDTSVHMLQYTKEDLSPAALRMINLWSRDLGVALVMTARRYLAP